MMYLCATDINDTAAGNKELYTEAMLATGMCNGNIREEGQCRVTAGRCDQEHRNRVGSSKSVI